MWFYLHTSDEESNLPLKPKLESGPFPSDPFSALCLQSLFQGRTGDPTILTTMSEADL